MSKNNFRNKIFTIGLAVCVMLSASSCGKNKLKGFELGHFDGSDETNGYDTDLLYKNTSEFLGGDSGVIWVSKEEDPEYGGYFYQYMSECASVANNNVPSTADGDQAENESDAVYTSHIAVSRSKDMYDWELCGAVDNGLCLKLGMNAFTNHAIWAPETIRDPKTGKYFMYFGGGNSSNYAKIFKEKYADFYSSSDLDKLVKSKIYVTGVAVSDSPVGPFEIVTSENFYGGQPNLNGEILTEEEPTFDFVKWFGDCQFDSYCADFAPFFDENGDLYLVWNSGALGGISCWGMKMRDMVTPDYSTVTLLMTCGDVDEPVDGDDGPTDPSKPWRDSKIAAPVRVEYKGSAANNAAIAPKYGEDTAHYVVNQEYINDPSYPRFDPKSYINWEEWSDGTPNTKTKVVNGTEQINPDYNAHEGVGKSTIREGVQIISYRNKSGKTQYYLTFTYTGVQSALYDVHFAVSSSPLGNKKGDEYTLPKGKEFSTSLGVDASNDYMSNLGHVDFVEVDGEWWIAHWEWTVPFGTTPSFDIGRIYALSPMTWLDDSRVDYYVPVANGPTKHLQAKPYAASGYKNIAGEAKIEATNVQGDTLKYLTDGYTVTKNMYADRVMKAKGNTTITITFDSPRVVRGILIYNSYNYENAFSKIANIRFTLAEKPSYYTGTGDGTLCYINDLDFPESAYKASDRTIYSGIASVATFDELKVKEITVTISDHLGGSEILNIAEIMILGK